jgi:hypothetical protein
VKAVGRDRRVAALQLSGEENVAELAGAVDAAGAEAAAAGLEVVEVESAALVGIARGRDDASARGREPLEQQVCQREWSEMVEREGLLEPSGVTWRDVNIAPALLASTSMRG